MDILLCYRLGDFHGRIEGGQELMLVARQIVARRGNGSVQGSSLKADEAMASIRIAASN